MSVFNEFLTVYAQSLNFLGQGVSVFPLIGGDDAARGKAPAVRWSKYRQRFPSVDELGSWFEDRQFSAYGVVCGQVSRLVVLDFDDMSAALRFGAAFPVLMETLVTRSGVRRTPHFYWRVDFPVKTRKLPGGDLKGEGSYVVGPRSMVGGCMWDILIDRPIRAVTSDELRCILEFLDLSRPQPVVGAVSGRSVSVDDRFDASQAARPVLDQLMPAGAAAVYRSRVERTHLRNESLFRTACYLRDEGKPEAWTVAALARVHAVEPPRGSHYDETSEMRYQEAVATIRSAYSRPPRPRCLSNGLAASRLPGSLREKLLLRSDGAAVLRVIEGLYMNDFRAGCAFTELQAQALLKPLSVGRHSLRRALAASTDAGERLFEIAAHSPSPRTSSLASADTSPVSIHNKNCGFVSPTESDRSIFSPVDDELVFRDENPPHRPPRYYLFPDVETLCRKLGVEPSSGDMIEQADVASPRRYRQALQREFIKRRPGGHYLALLAARLSVSPRTLQRYHREMALQSRPTYREIWIFAPNLDQLPPAEDYRRYSLERGGRFIEDETGKRYPPIREIAARLLSQKHTVVYKIQSCNAYWYGDPPPETHPLPDDVPQPAAEKLDDNTALWQWRYEERYARYAELMGARSHTMALPDDSPRPSPEAAEVAAVQPPLFPEKKAASPAKSKKQPAKKPRQPKRDYQKPLDDPRLESLANSVCETVRSLTTAEKAMSLANARRLIVTYGWTAVGRTLNTLAWLSGRQQIQNPAGFMIAASRAQWRKENGANSPDSPSPRFEGEPARRPRKKPYNPLSDALTRSERWLVWRIGFAEESGDWSASAAWQARLGQVLEKRSITTLRKRRQSAAQSKAPDEIAFWSALLDWKAGRFEGDVDALVGRLLHVVNQGRALRI